jgi:hypothetical protein
VSVFLHLPTTGHKKMMNPLKKGGNSKMLC